jgi:hypothetical protein
MALVIKRWAADRVANGDGNFVHIIGREAGLLSWLLSLVKVDPTTEVEVKERLVVFTKGSLEGSERRVIPLSSVSSAFYGYKKPWKEALVLGLILLPLFGVGLVVGPLYYFLNKQLTVGIVEVSGWAGGFAFKRSVIEGANIDERQAHEVIEIIRERVEARTAA